MKSVCSAASDYAQSHTEMASTEQRAIATTQTQTYHTSDKTQTTKVSRKYEKSQHYG